MTGRDDHKRRGRASTLDELERIARRFALLPLALPVLLTGGWVLGKFTATSLARSEASETTDIAITEVPQLEDLGRIMERLRQDGEITADHVIMYRDHVGPVEEILRRQGMPDSTARLVAWPLVEYSYRHGLDPALVAAIMLLESRGRPDATSPVGARGLMQVMPGWLGRWRECGHDLYDIEDNICHGTNILAWYLTSFRGDERRALLGYNGCVEGTTTPSCFSYPDRVQRLRRQIQGEWELFRGITPAAAAR